MKHTEPTFLQHAAALVVASALSLLVLWGGACFLGYKVEGDSHIAHGDKMKMLAMQRSETITQKALVKDKAWREQVRARWALASLKERCSIHGVAATHLAGSGTGRIERNYWEVVEEATRMDFVLHK